MVTVQEVREGRLGRRPPYEKVWRLDLYLMVNLLVWIYLRRRRSLSATKSAFYSFCGRPSAGSDCPDVVPWEASWSVAFWFAGFGLTPWWSPTQSFWTRSCRPARNATALLFPAFYFLTRDGNILISVWREKSVTELEIQRRATTCDTPIYSQ